MKRALILAALFSTGAHAATWLDLGGASYHTKAGRRGSNPGFGIQHDLNKADFIAFGGYINSDDNVSRYMTFGRRFVSDGVVSAGLFGGIVDGYPGRNDGNFDYFAGPFVSIEGRWAGINLVFLPPSVKNGAAALSLQFKVKIEE